jgi:hypothetical protein
MMLRRRRQQQAPARRRRRLTTTSQFFFLSSLLCIAVIISMLSIHKVKIISENDTHQSTTVKESITHSPSRKNHHHGTTQTTKSINAGNSTTSSPPKSRTTSVEWEQYSSVDFYACCGLGHRLIRMASANLIAKELDATLRSFWGYCHNDADGGGTTEVFSHLFEPERISMDDSPYLSKGQYLPVYYDVKPGFETLRRGNYSLLRTSRQECPCRQDEFRINLEFFRSLRDRFRQQKRVQDFVEHNFSNSTVIGLHVRAGNGEQGDFQTKGRGIDNPKLWVKQVCDQLQVYLSQQQQQSSLKRPPVLYLATDTPSMIEHFRIELSKPSAPIKIPVIIFPQMRLVEGQGVLYGEKTHQSILNSSRKQSRCLQGWEDALIDMILLSHADLVIAGKPSMFIQSLPMTIAFGKAKEDRMFSSSHSYCEVQPYMERKNGDESGDWSETDQRLECYSSFVEWCCNAPRRSKEMVIVRDQAVKTSSFHLKERKLDCPRPPLDARTFTRYCLPYEWT